MTIHPRKPNPLSVRTLMKRPCLCLCAVLLLTWPVRGDDPFPYVPGIEALGTVVEAGSAVDAKYVGANVVTMMQGL